MGLGIKALITTFGCLEINSLFTTTRPSDETYIKISEEYAQVHGCLTTEIPKRLYAFSKNDEVIKYLI